jgi:hypothetical protein
LVRQKYLASHWLGAIVGNWSLAGSDVANRRAVHGEHQVNNTFVFSAGGQRANVLRDPNLPDSEKSLGRWFDTSAFAQPAQFTFGNQGVNILRADGHQPRYVHSAQLSVAEGKSVWANSSTSPITRTGDLAQRSIPDRIVPARARDAGFRSARFVFEYG